jgi:hypothetical protein
MYTTVKTISLYSGVYMQYGFEALRMLGGKRLKNLVLTQCQIFIKQFIELQDEQPTQKSLECIATSTRNSFRDFDNTWG